MSSLLFLKIGPPTEWVSEWVSDWLTILWPKPRVPVGLKILFCCFLETRKKYFQFSIHNNNIIWETLLESKFEDEWFSFSCCHCLVSECWKRCIFSLSLCVLVTVVSKSGLSEEFSSSTVGKTAFEAEEEAGMGDRREFRNLSIMKVWQCKILSLPS